MQLGLGVSHQFPINGQCSIAACLLNPIPLSSALVPSSDALSSLNFPNEGLTIEVLSAASEPSITGSRRQMVDLMGAFKCAPTEAEPCPPSQAWFQHYALTASRRRIPRARNRPSLASHKDCLQAMGVVPCKDRQQIRSYCK